MSPHTHAIQKVIESAPAHLSSLQLLSLLKAESLLYPNTFDEEMEKLGYACQSILLDCPLLLQKISSELSKSYAHPIQTLSDLIEAKEPSILYIQRGAFRYFQPKERDRIRKRFPFIKTITGFWGAELEKPNDYELFEGLDHLFCINDFIQDLVSKGCNRSSPLPPCVEETHDFSIEPKKKSGLTFAGVSGYGFSDHSHRYLMLEKLQKELPLELYCDEPKLPVQIHRIKYFLAKYLGKLPKSTLATLMRCAPKKAFSTLEMAIFENEGTLKRPLYLTHPPLSILFPERVHPALFGQPFFTKLKESLIALNIHSDNILHHSNQRCFEATAMGTCLLTDRTHLMSDLFEEGSEIIGYNSIEEAIEKGKWLLAHPEKALEIGREGQKRTLKDHTLAKRCEEIDRVLQLL